MGFSGKVAYAVDFVVFEYFVHADSIADIGLYKNISIFKIVLNIGKVLGVAGISQLVHIHDASLKIGFSQQISDKIRTDETAPAGNQHVLHSNTFDKIALRFYIVYRPLRASLCELRPDKSLDAKAAELNIIFFCR
jgi:hypothetical protein